MNMPLRSEHLYQPSQSTVDDVVAQIRGWRAVTPDQRVALRSAVATLPIMDIDWMAQAGPVDRPLRVAEVAEILNVSKQHVRNLIKTGELRGMRLSASPGAEFRVTESAVREFLAGAA